jgi:uncharacterized protein (DUF302 family)
MESWQIPTLGLTIRVRKCYADVLERVVNGLRKEGFVVMTEIDIQETLKRKLNVDSLPFKILRVYSPNLSNQARSAVPDAALLPYNITIAQMEDGSVEVSLVDPLSVLTMTENPGLRPIVREAHNRLQRMVDDLNYMPV